MTRTVPLDVRRHTNGLIDFDYYRARAAAVRDAAHRETAALKFLIAGITLSSCLLVALLAFAVMRPTTVVETIPPTTRTVVR